MQVPQCSCLSFCLHSCWKVSWNAVRWCFLTLMHIHAEDLLYKIFRHVCLEKVIYYVTLMYCTFRSKTLLFLLMYSWKLCLSDCYFNMLNVLSSLQQVWFWTWLLLKKKIIFLSIYNHLIHRQHFENVV